MLVTQIFFGLWLVPLGYLAYRSGMFPKVLGIVLIARSPRTVGARLLQASGRRATRRSLVCLVW